MKEKMLCGNILSCMTVVMVESLLAHKVTYFPETPSGGFHMGYGVCLCSFPSAQ